ncbi:phytanoyl-CoA dioxygenase family protein [Streptomyces sp. AN091965]|uniref:phytanoyl-CoA dioxygenase family protein n=1 Tax=Streptomyces sp. AN091965 TaxID=2927803 RepID=UPI001F61E897|nr:phytanoyl-CoA dioxygenase family protein [Streptomyces sp. AN091965]MCI3934064.1 phytanoyl-CoA dioxygenase family protein [Streptomyces sp. AN091965]
MNLSSNGVPIPFSPELFGPLRPTGTEPLPDPAVLRERLRADGYLYLPGFLDPEEVLRLRSAYFSLLPRGYFAPGTTPREGVFSGRVPKGLPEHGVAGHPAHAFVRSETFDRFLDNPQLAKLAADLLDGDARMLPRRILRHFHRGTARASRAHVDLDYMDEGSPRVVTMWIPVGDCPPKSGALVYLEGSHTLSPEEYEPLRDTTDRPEDRRQICHDLEFTARALDRRWLHADFAAGDLMVHVPSVIHASLDTTTDAMRLSIDTRFVRAGDTPDPRWLRPWSADDGA